MKPSNRVIQYEYKTYETRSEISEALYLLRQYINESTYKWLSHFLYTNNGVTQAKNETICELSGVSRSNYYKTVKPEIELLFDEPLVIRQAAPRKFSRNKKQRARASEYKIFQPIRKIKQLVAAKLQEEKEQFLHDMETFFAVGGPGGGPGGGLDEKSEKPLESKVEETFLQQESNSFRENLLENPLNKFNDPAEIRGALFGHAPKKITIKSDIANYLLDFPVFKDFVSWTEHKRYEVARTLQLAVIKAQADIKHPRIKHAVKNAVSSFLERYKDKPASEYIKLLYSCVFNAIKPQQQTEDRSEENTKQKPISHKSSTPIREEKLPTWWSPAAEYYAAFPTQESIIWDDLRESARDILGKPRKDNRPHDEKVAEIEAMLAKLRP